MITTIILVTICYIKNYYSIIDYIPYVVYYILWLIYFITGSLYLLIPFTYFAKLSLLLPGNHLFVLCINESISVLFAHLFCLDSTYKWNYTIFVFIWLISLSIIPLGASMLSQMAKFYSFLWLSNIPVCVCVCVCVCITSSLSTHLSMSI